MIPSLKLPEQTFVAPQQNGESGASGSVKELFEQALSEPIEFPALSDFLFSGDHVVFVLLEDLQSKAQCVTGLLSYLEKHAQTCRVDILSAQPIELPENEREGWIEQFKSAGIELSFHQHDQKDADQVAYIAASYAGEPIYVNRHLFEADTIIPVYSTENVDADGRPSIYPEFSSAATAKRFAVEEKSEYRGEARQAFESIGICYVIQVTTGAGGQIKHVQSGEYGQVASQTGSSSDSDWQIDRYADARVVVATIESPATGQTWDHFFRALIAAAAVSENVQQIVICSSIETLPTESHYQLLQIPFETEYEAIERILTAASDYYRGIPGIFEESTVYLQSQLAEADVEELGLGFIANDSEIQRIVDNAQSGVFLRDAHLCRIAEQEE